MKKSMPFSVTAMEPSQPFNSAFLFQPQPAWLMGVLNLTPDSFYANSRVSSHTSLLSLAGRMIDEGADILDLGGESTRPGSAGVSEAEERERVIPAVQALRASWPTLPLSVDTQKASVAEQALDSGATLINDVSALRHDPAMADVVAEAQCPVVLMHMQGTPQTMQDGPHYTDVVSEVKSFFEERMAFAIRRGIREENILLDPGIGFGKLTQHNMDLLRHLSKLKALGRPLLVGVSRKAFIGRVLGEETAPLAVEERLEGTISASLWAVQEGARGLRVHDVGAMRRALTLWEGLAAS